MTASSTRPARVLEIGGYPPPRGGWSMRIELVKKALTESGHQCAVLNIGESRLIPSPEYDTVSGLGDFVSKVWRYTRRGYVAHTHANGEFSKGLGLALVAQLIGWMFGRRGVLTFHAGTDQPCFPRANAPCLAPVYSLLFGTARTIICNSERVKRAIVDYGITPSKIVPIQAFTRQYLQFHPATIAPEVKSFLDGNAEVVFTYIRVQPGYFLDTLVEGFARLRRTRDVGLLVVGATDSGETALWKRMDDRLTELGVRDKVMVVGDVDHDMFLTLLTRCAVYLRTPSSDGIAASVLEALALGVPVVASDNGTRPPSVVTYPAEDPERLAQAVEHVLIARAAGQFTISIPDLPDTLADEVAVLVAS